MKKIKSTMLSTLLIALYSQTFVSCSGKIKLDIDSEGFTNPYYTQKLVELKKQDDNCSAVNSEVSAWEFSIYQLSLDGDINQVEIDAKNQVNNNLVMSILNSPIKSTSFNGKTNQVYQYRFNDYEQSYYLEGMKDTQLLKQKEDLKVCAQKSTIYERDTFEGVALSVSDSVHRTYEMINEVKKEIDFSLSLSPVDVNIAPSIRQQVRFVEGERHGKQLYVFEADNAFYNPLESSLTFLPQSQESRDNGVTPFWEVPMVASHEYGHHVFHLLFNQYRMDEILSDENQDYRKNGHKHSCFMNKAQYEYTQKLHGEDERDNTSSFTIRSLNEGFADLIAFYTLPDEKLSLKKLECFEKTRSVFSSVNINNEEKVFSYSGLENMDKSSIAFSSESTCDSINYQESHSLGSVMAYQFDRILNLAEYEKKDKLKLSIVWLNKLKENHSKLTKLSASNYMFHAFELLFKAIQEDKISSGTSLETINNDLRDDCLVMDNIFLRGSNPKCLYLTNK